MRAGPKSAQHSNCLCLSDNYYGWALFEYKFRVGLQKP